MGTSSSGTGPGPGVPLVPPWVPDPLNPTDWDAPENPDDQNPPAQPAPEPQPAPAHQSAPLAPPARFRPARTSLGRFARNGSADDMRRGIGHYVRRGYRGADSATQRMGGTARTAGKLYIALSSAAAGQTGTPSSPFDPVILAGRSADEVMDALVEVVRPTDGTQDAEGARAAIRSAMADLLNRFPDANILELSEDQRLFTIERYVALDVFNRFNLDLGKTIQKRAPSAVAGLTRLKEIKDYVKQTVSARFRALIGADEQFGARRVSELARQALRATFEVFEDYTG